MTYLKSLALPFIGGVITGIIMVGVLGFLMAVLYK